MFSVGDTSFRISYAGGTGNDVVLTAEAWNGPKRWLGSHERSLVGAGELAGRRRRRVDGDSLYFPYYGSFSHAMWNDVPGLTLGSVTSSGTDFSVGGETVTLTGSLDFPDVERPDDPRSVARLMRGQLRQRDRAERPRPDARREPLPGRSRGRAR